jgi:hypothetical protein
MLYREMLNWVVAIILVLCVFLFDPPWLLPAAALLFLCDYVIRVYRARQHIDHSMRDLKEEGYPTTLEAFEAWYVRVPEEENAIPLMHRAIQPLNKEYELSVSPDSRGGQVERLHLPSCIQEELPTLSKVLDEQRLADLLAFEATHESTMNFISRAAACSSSRTDYDFRNWAKDWDPVHYDYFRNANLILCHLAMAHSQQGEAGAATSLLCQAFQLPHLVAQDPLLFSQIMHDHLGAMTLRTLEWCLRHHNFHPNQLRQLGRQLKQLEENNSMPKAVAGEIALIMDTFEIQNKECPSMPWPLSLVDTSSLGGWLYRFSGFSTINKRRMLNLLNMMHTMSELPLEESLQAVNDLRLQGRIPAAVPIMQGRGQLSFRILEAYQNNRGLARLARTALAVEAYSLEHEHYPAKLEAIAPDFMSALPVDPYNESAFISYTQQPGGLCFRGQKFEMFEQYNAAEMSRFSFILTNLRASIAET